MECYKCGGSGKLPHYAHIGDGVCFQCKGAGITSSKKQAPTQEIREIKGKSGSDYPWTAFTIHPLDIDTGGQIQSDLLWVGNIGDMVCVKTHESETWHLVMSKEKARGFLKLTGRA